MSDKQENQNKAEFILPILCPHCQKEVGLAMGFELMPPKNKDESKKEDTETASEEGAETEEKE